jgi:hypothetical protein
MLACLVCSVCSDIQVHCNTKHIRIYKALSKCFLSLNYDFFGIPKTSKVCFLHPINRHISLEERCVRFFYKLRLINK